MVPDGWKYRQTVTSAGDNNWSFLSGHVHINIQVQNKNRTFKTPDIPYFTIWSFETYLSDHDVGSLP